MQNEIIEKLGEKFKLEKVFVSGTEIENFVGVWGMKRPQVTALAAENLTDADKKILYEKILAVSRDGTQFQTI